MPGRAAADGGLPPKMMTEGSVKFRALLAALLAAMAALPLAAEPIDFHQALELALKHSGVMLAASADRDARRAALQGRALCLHSQRDLRLQPRLYHWPARRHRRISPFAVQHHPPADPVQPRRARHDQGRPQRHDRRRHRLRGPLRPGHPRYIPDLHRTR